MATGFNTQTGEGKYCIQFETTHPELYKAVQDACRKAVDEEACLNYKNLPGGGIENRNNHIGCRGIHGNCGVEVDT